MTDFETEFARRNALSHALAMAPCLQDHFLEMRETAETSLIRILPSLRAEDRDWIDPEEMRALLKALDPARVGVTIAILKALMQVGDKRALPYVTALFARLGDRAHPEARQVRAAAYDCLLYLRAHAIRSNQSELLLRGSHQPAGEAILLRPAQEASPGPVDDLLRPGISPCRPNERKGNLG